MDQGRMMNGHAELHRIHTRGFTLIELMVAVAIVAIIAAIAYPNYLKQVRDSRRTTAITNLLNMSSQLEKYYSTNNVYPASLTYMGYSTTVYVVPNASNPYYDISYGVNTTMTSFTLTANPVGDQAQDACGSFSLSSLGIKSVSSTTQSVSNCWGN
ncbi:type IV pilin protein [Acidihalobacter aeolianus]|nr:type IV pilin protein [Acidihalobacter aeolianus]